MNIVRWFYCIVNVDATITQQQRLCQQHFPAMRFVINVWCAIYYELFYDSKSTGLRYFKLLQDVKSDFVENLLLLNFRNLCFQNDGAPVYKISPVKQFYVNYVAACDASTSTPGFISASKCIMLCAPMCTKLHSNENSNLHYS